MQHRYCKHSYLAVLFAGVHAASEPIATTEIKSAVNIANAFCFNVFFIIYSFFLYQFCVQVILDAFILNKKYESKMNKKNFLNFLNPIKNAALF